MSEKTDSKKQLIVEKATEIFAIKGYKTVTMKDVVEACQISRGGLYLYYSSTEEIFKDVLEAEEKANADGKNVAQMLSQSKAAELLVWFIKEKKKEILKRKNSLVVAKYEYAFCRKANDDVAEAKTIFETETAVLANILTRGNESGEFECADTAAMARSMMYAIEGMKILSVTVGISENDVDKELLFMMKQFVDA